MKRSVKKYLLEIVGLQTPLGRLVVVFSITVLLHSISYSTLTNTPTLSLFTRLNISSPSIGLTRAYWYLIHGNISGAWHMNKLVFLVSAVVVVMVIVDIIALIKQHRQYFRDLKPSYLHQ